MSLVILLLHDVNDQTLWYTNTCSQEHYVVRKLFFHVWHVPLSGTECLFGSVCFCKPSAQSNIRQSKLLSWQHHKHLNNRHCGINHTPTHTHTGNIHRLWCVKTKFLAKEKKKRRERQNDEIKLVEHTQLMTNFSFVQFHFCIIAELVYTGAFFFAARLMQMTLHCPIKLLDERIKWNRTIGQHWLWFIPRKQQLRVFPFLRSSMKHSDTVL